MTSKRRLYIGAEDGTVSAVDIPTGEQLWLQSPSRNNGPVNNLVMYKGFVLCCWERSTGRFHRKTGNVISGLGRGLGFSVSQWCTPLFMETSSSRLIAIATETTSGRNLLVWKRPGSRATTKPTGAATSLAEAARLPVRNSKPSGGATSEQKQSFYDNDESWLDRFAKAAAKVSMRFEGISMSDPLSQLCREAADQYAHDMANIDKPSAKSPTFSPHSCDIPGCHSIFSSEKLLLQHVHTIEHDLESLKSFDDMSPADILGISGTPTSEKVNWYSLCCV